jgi:hypothetical protein
LPKITHHSRTLEKKRKKVRPPSSRGEAGEAMRNLTGTIPGYAYRRARVWAAQTTRQSPQLSAISSKKRAPEGVIFQRLSVPNHNPSSHIPLPAAGIPKPKIFSGF